MQEQEGRASRDGIEGRGMEYGGKWSSDLHLKEQIGESRNKSTSQAFEPKGTE